MEHILPTNTAASDPLPAFITEPGSTDWLMMTMAVFLIVVVISFGLLYLRLHALPEHIAHRTNKVQLQFVCILALLAMFTHNNAFWIAALLLALVTLPDFSTPMKSIAHSLEKLSGLDLPASSNDLPLDHRGRETLGSDAAPDYDLPRPRQPAADVSTI